jgi:hypothetical protein
MTEWFSQRIGKTPRRTALQVEAIDEPLKNSIWNVLNHYFRQAPHLSGFGSLARSLTLNYLKLPIDRVPEDDEDRYTYVYDYYFHEISEWWVVYDFLQLSFATYTRHVYKHGYSTPSTPTQFSQAINNVLESEASAYRLLEGQVVPISNPSEVATIEDAVNCALPGASAHITSALGFLAIKPKPDYRNAIKESISAVESACKVLSGKTTGGLDDALEVLGQKYPLHGALRAAFLSLYGYTSDEKGIRHALLDDSTTPAGYPEAKFMLVACSAFVNYLVDRTR